ncbi:uncharacterized protein cubi_00914 [Cryptosporidium ubiquitum]|uniref:Uncharacterized protein n=1 Tax=Cryptosporidium ubiquitum TaxID=857276 RepID=A0A1J4M973_9CRYT|nr:uncharacterized protein cubi_00914 [Cryptosporidium ubiquitum]OII70769.1 hypothetical protein cubi_00914 [Cryptosporidium ubiquitum]
MDDEVEKLRKQAEIRKRRLLERSSARLKLIYPNYEESTNNESFESIPDDESGEFSKAKLIKNDNDLDYNKDNDSISDGFNTSRVSTSSTFPAFSQGKIYEETEEKDFCSDFRLVSYIEYWNQGESDRLRKIGSCILGVLLFLTHNFVPDSFSFQFLPVKINSISGIISFFIYQILISQIYFYNYFRLLIVPTGSNKVEKKTLCKIILGCNSTQKVDYFVAMNNIIQYALAIKNFISEWLLLVTFYSFVSFIHSSFLTN